MMVFSFLQNRTQAQTAKPIVWSLLFLGFLFGLPGCENARKELGLEKTPPDEFAIVKREPLELPPSFSLPTPRPGAPRPQEQSPEQKAKASIFGEEKKQTTQKSKAVDYEFAAQKPQTSAGENILLQQTGALESNKSIRDLIDAETRVYEEEQKPAIKRLLSLTGKKYEAPAKVVDAPGEMQRIKDNLEQGRSVTDGETPTREF